jgi:hypothetical protein
MGNCPACGYGFSGERPTVSWEKRIAPFLLLAAAAGVAISLLVYLRSC